MDEVYVIIMDAQGNASLNFPKKNVKVDFCEDEWVSTLANLGVKPYIRLGYVDSMGAYGGVD